MWPDFLVSRGTAVRRGKKVRQAPLRQVCQAKRLADMGADRKRPHWSVLPEWMPDADRMQMFGCPLTGICKPSWATKNDFQDQQDCPLTRSFGRHRSACMSIPTHRTVGIRWNARIMPRHRYAAPCREGCGQGSNGSENCQQRAVVRCQRSKGMCGLKTCDGCRNGKEKRDPGTQHGRTSKGNKVLAEQ